MASGLEKAFVADMREMKAAVEDLERAEKKAQNTTQDMFRRMGEGTNQNIRRIKEQEEGTNGIVEQVTKYALGMGAVKTAWDLTTGSVDAHFQHLAKVSEEVKKIVDQAQGIATSAGDNRWGRSIKRQALFTSELGIATDEELLAAYGAYRDVDKEGKIWYGDFFKHAQTAATGGEKDLGTWAKIVGALTTGGVEGGRAVNLAAKLQEQAGGEATAVMKKLRFWMKEFGDDHIDQAVAVMLAGAHGGKAGLLEKEDIESWADAGGTAGGLIGSLVNDDPRFNHMYNRELRGLGNYDGHLTRRMQTTLEYNPEFARQVAIQRVRNKAKVVRSLDEKAASEEDLTMAYRELEDAGLRGSGYGTGWIRDWRARAETGQSELEAAADSAGDDLLGEVKKMNNRLDQATMNQGVE